MVGGVFREAFPEGWIGSTPPPFPVIKSLVEKTPHLVELDISDCETLTDQSLETVVAHCKALETMAFSRCHHVTSFGVEKLVTLPRLKCLVFFGCFPEFQHEVGVSAGRANLLLRAAEHLPLPHPQQKWPHLTVNANQLMLISVFPLPS